jgi:hypothetical protein
MPFIEWRSRIWDAVESVPTRLGRLILARGGPGWSAWTRLDPPGPAWTRVEFFLAKPEARGTRLQARGEKPWKIFRAFARFSALFHFFPRWKARISAISANFRPPSPIGMGYGAPRGADSMKNEKFGVRIRNRDMLKHGLHTRARARAGGEAGHAGALARVNEVSARLRPDVPAYARMCSLAIILSFRTGSPSGQAPWGGGRDCELRARV